MHFKIFFLALLGAFALTSAAPQFDVFAFLTKINTGINNALTSVIGIVNATANGN